MDFCVNPHWSAPANDAQRHAIRAACRLLGGVPQKRRGALARSLHIDELEAGGVDRPVMSWMHFQGFVTHVHLSKSRLVGAERAGASAVVGRTSSFAFTDLGREFGALLLAKNRAGDRIVLPMGELTPRYHPVRRERHFSWGVHLLKRFSRRPGNQETILAAFEEQAWEPEIDDPLTGNGIIRPVVRVHNTIKDLNRHQSVYLVHFEGLGYGTAIGWGLR